MSFGDEGYRPPVEVQILEAVGIVSGGGVKLIRLEVTKRPDGSSIELKARDLPAELFDEVLGLLAQAKLSTSSRRD